MDREASQKEREKDHPTFKDNDFLNDGVKIHIGEEAKEKVAALRSKVFVVASIRNWGTKKSCLGSTCR